MTQTNDPPLISSLELIPDADEKADLDAPNTSGGKLVIGQAPNITITETTVVADAAERLALDVQEGDIAIQQNVSSSFIFTGGDNVANNWETIDFDAVGAIDGETISPANIDVSGSINGADTSAAAAGEALTSDGGGGFSFASVGGIETATTFNNLPTSNPPQIGYVTDEDSYYVSVTGVFNIEKQQPAGSISSIDGSPQGIRWNDDGTKLYEIGSDTNTIYESICSTAFDITTFSQNASIATQDGRPTGLVWNNDGTKLYEVGSDSNKFYQFDLTTAYDLTTATFVKSANTQDTGPLDIEISADGTKILHTDASDNIYQYTLSTPFELDTLSFDKSVPSRDAASSGLAWKNDGTKLYESGFGQDKIFQSTVSTPFDIGNYQFEKSIPTQSSQIRGIAWNNDGSKLYECSNDGEIYQYEAGWIQLI